MATFTHEEVVRAFINREKTWGSNNIRTVWNGAYVMYDSEEQTFYSYGYDQPLAKWVNVGGVDNIVALRLDERSSKTTHGHSDLLRCEETGYGDKIIWVEPVETFGDYGVGWKHKSRKHYVKFPSPEYFDSVLRPEPEKPEVKFTQRTCWKELGMVDENGQSYHEKYYTYVYRGWVAKKDKRYWILKYGNGQKILRRLGDAKTLIANWHMYFNTEPWNVSAWRVENPGHPHQDQVQNLCLQWHFESRELCV